MSSEGGERLRINQFLARAGVASRRGAEALILEGRVTLNGHVVRELAVSVDPTQRRGQGGRPPGAPPRVGLLFRPLQAHARW